MAFMPAHLRALGFSGPQISAALAAAPVMSLAVPLGWAWLADRTQRHDRVLQVVACGAWLGFTPLLFAQDGRPARVRRRPGGLPLLRLLLGRNGRPGRRAGGGAGASRRGLRPPAPMGLSRFRLFEHGRRPADPARVRAPDGSAGSAGHVGCPGRRVRGRAAGRGHRRAHRPPPRSGRPRAAAPAGVALAADRRRAALDVHGALQRFPGRVPAGPGIAAAVVGGSRTPSASPPRW